MPLKAIYRTFYFDKQNSVYEKKNKANSLTNKPQKLSLLNENLK